MATIYSNYSPQDRELLERETGQHNNDDTDPWQVDATQRRKAPPRFVPASSHDSPVTSAPPTHPGSDVASWYKSFPRSDTTTPLPSTDTPPPIPSLEKRNKNNWFILKAIESPPIPSPPPSLAEILARDPPPPPTSRPFKPPIWLAIGPSNKGFSMLQRKGWNEGEPLGPSVIRQPVRAPHTIVKREAVAVDDDISEIRQVIDLTLDDSEDEDSTIPEPEPDPYAPRALLTPLPTLLKSDRLGLGLKAKTVINAQGYRESQKRVTHNAAALAKHIRDAEEARKTRNQHGRGKRGLQRASKKEAAQRKEMLIYLNS